MNKDNFSEDQLSALDRIIDWIKHDDGVLRLGGYAGTGKTTIVSELRNILGHENSIAFCAFTGKATSVLKKKLENLGTLSKNDECCTIHSLIYDPIIDKNSGEITGWVKKRSINFDLIIVDEASMVSQEIFTDLTSYGIPILAVGDHGQLPPVNSQFNLMAEPEIRLEKAHRFAEGSDIIKASILAREEGHIPHMLTDGVLKVPPKSEHIKTFYDKYYDPKTTIVLCHKNKTRVSLNNQIRRSLGYKGDKPHKGERVVCLKNNKESKHIPIYNGLCGTVRYILGDSGTHYRMSIDIDGYEDNREKLYYSGSVDKYPFNKDKIDFNYKSMPVRTEKVNVGGDKKPFYRNRKIYPDLFDFGYCLTAHKSQGSEWPYVIVKEESQYMLKKDGSWNKWLYTVVTRATEKLLIVG